MFMAWTHASEREREHPNSGERGEFRIRMSSLPVSAKAFHVSSFASNGALFAEAIQLHSIANCATRDHTDISTQRRCHEEGRGEPRFAVPGSPELGLAEGYRGPVDGAVRGPESSNNR